MTVFEMYERLTNTGGALLCIDKETLRVYSDPMELPVDFAGKDEREARFER